MAARRIISPWRVTRTPLISSAQFQRQHIRAFSTTKHVSEDKTMSSASGIADLDALPSPLPFPLDEATFDKVKTSLMNRQLPILQDIISSTPSHSLDVTLSDFLPFVNVGYQSGRLGWNPQFSKHLVYFPPQDRLSQLLPDQTDPAQSPGSPFDRRMWAGGRIIQVDSAESKSPFGKIHSERSRDLAKEYLTTCVERISDVKLKGSGESQKIFVTLERRIGRSAGPLGKGNGERIRLFGDMSNCGIIEHRNLVFMPAKKGSGGAAKSDGAEKGASHPKVVKAPHAADFSVTLTPTQDLLFRFSALTFNAHRIHLDKAYCRDVEGHRNLLVHGPMSCVMMCEVLRNHLRTLFNEATKDGLTREEVNSSNEQKPAPHGLRLVDFTYRNLAPLYAEEPMTVCVRRKSQDLVIDQRKRGDDVDQSKLNEWPLGTGKLAEVDEIYSDANAEGVKPVPNLRYAQFDCWVENKDGSLCVRGTAICQILSHEDKLATPRKA